MADNSSKDSEVATSTTSVVYFTGSKAKMSASTTVSWIIEDMEEKMKSLTPKFFLKTDIFSIKGSKWSCKIWPNGCKEEYRGNISIILVSESDEPFMVNCVFSVGKGNSEHDKSFKQELSRQTSPNNWGWKDFLPHEIVQEKKKQLMQCGRMEFTIRISIDEEDTPGPQVSLMEETSEINVFRELSENFSNILQDENTSDFLIQCGDDKLPVHRNVIKARSSYFDGLLSNGFAESSTGQIVIEDMDSNTLKRVIEFIYTGKIKDVESNPTQLLKAADMYDLPLLRKACEDELISSMNLENVVDLFVLAEDHNAVELRVAAKKMILENKSDIVKQDGWHTKLGTLVIELFEAI